MAIKIREITRHCIWDHVKCRDDEWLMVLGQNGELKNSESKLAKLEKAKFTFLQKP
jgi:hypothetical protein